MERNKDFNSSSQLFLSAGTLNNLNVRREKKKSQMKCHRNLSCQWDTQFISKQTQENDGALTKQFIEYTLCYILRLIFLITEEEN